MKAHLAAGRARWRQFVTASPLRRIGHSALVSACAQVGAKGVGFLKEIVVASAFGLADGVDVYLVAFVVVGFPLSILLNAAQTALVAALVEGRGDRLAPSRVYGATVLATLAVAALALPLWFLFLHFSLPLFAAGFAPAKLEALRAALFALIPYTVFNGLNLLGYAALQARQRFFLNGILPATTPFVVGAVAFIGRGGDALPALVLGLGLGTVLECALLHLALWRDGVRAAADLRGAGFGAVARATLTLAPGMLFVAVGPVIEQAIAAALEGGTVAALGYGLRIPNAVNGVLVSAVAAASLPHFAALLQRGERAYGLHALRRLAAVLLGGGALLGAVLALASGPIVHLVFERGAFDAASVARVVPVQQAYFVQLPLALVAALGMRVLAAGGAHHQISLATAAGVTVQMALAWTLGQRFGAAGIAWAATLATGLLALVYYRASTRLLRPAAP